jgi:hypothetical protein
MIQIDSVKNPWSDRAPMDSSSWFLPGELERITRHNDRLRQAAAGAKSVQQARDIMEKFVVTAGPTGGFPIPLLWAGNPWDAPVLLLLLNPSWGVTWTGTGVHDCEPMHCKASITNANKPGLRSLIDRTARGDWDPEYPNPFLHPDWRQADSWHARDVHGGIYRELTGLDPASGAPDESAWKRLSSRICVLELSGWMSRKWTTGCIGPTARLAADLASRAMRDPDRLVILGRGSGEWKQAGLLDADLAEKSNGVRSNQVRLSQKNFPGSWSKLMSLVK